MFEYLERFRRVFVCGPQRSGTRIAAKMIAVDTKHKYVDESMFAVDSMSYLMKTLLDQDKRSIVVQCPGMTRFIHRIARDSDAVVFMMRDLADIHASERRIGWRYESAERIKYGSLRPGSKSAEVKCWFWGVWQQWQIKNTFEVKYADLSQHALWVDKSKRGEFEWNQTVESR